MKRVIALSALLLGVAGAFALPASASTACVSIHLDVNGTVVDQAPCI